MFQCSLSKKESKLREIQQQTWDLKPQLSHFVCSAPATKPLSKNVHFFCLDNLLK